MSASKRQKKMWSQYLSTRSRTACASMDTATRDVALLDSFLSGCVINAVNINVLCLFYDGHRCLCRAATWYQSHSHALLSSSSCKQWVLSEKQAAAQVFFFAVDWHSQPGPPGLRAQSPTSVDDSFSLFVTPKKCSVPAFPPRITLPDCLHRVGSDGAGHANCLHARTNGSCQEICYVPTAKKELKKWFISNESLVTQRRP